MYVRAVFVHVCVCRAHQSTAEQNLCDEMLKQK